MYGYAAFYVLGFVVAGATGWHLGRRIGLDPSAWAALLAVTAVGGVLGSRVLHFDLAISGFGDRTFLGGLVGGALAFEAARRWLRIDARALDVMAIAVPAGHAVGRIGCFIAGCCAGAPTAHLHVAGLTTHPVQLYEVAVQVALVVLAVRLSGRLRPPGSVLLVVVGLYGLARAGLEGLRLDSWAQPGMTSTQWLAGLGGITALASAAWLVTRPQSGAAAATGRVARVALPALAGLPAVLFLARGEPFTPLEAAVLTGAGVLALPWLAPRARALALTAALPGALPAVVGILAIQALDTTAQRLPYTTFGAAASTGSYVESCGGAHRATVMGGSVTRTLPVGTDSWTDLRVYGFGGTDRDDHARVGIGGVGGSVAVDTRWVGAGIGLLAGNLVVDGLPEPVFPTAHLRLGRLDRFYLEGRLAEHEPVGIPLPGITVGAGFGVGDGGRLGAGVSMAGFYLTGLIPAERWGFEPFAAWGSTENWQFGLAVGARTGPAPLARER